MANCANAWPRAACSPGCTDIAVAIQTLSPDISFVISCEHGGNRIPPAYASVFADQRVLLDSHAGYDAGALSMARELATALKAPLFATTISRLLIDTNRSPGRRGLYSAITRRLPAAQRRAILKAYYLPYRQRVEAAIDALIAAGQRVIHLSSHSFTPQLRGEIRRADVGLLYDPCRAGENTLCRAWRQAIADSAPHVRVRRNYPYTGTSDGFTAFLRRRHGGDCYLGIEIEINQKHVLAGADHWHRVRRVVLGGLLRAFAAQGRGPGET